MKTKYVLNVIAALLIISILSCKKDSGPGAIPKVVSTDPKNSVTGVARNKEIAFTFDQAMDPLTINDSTFILMQGSTVIPGTVTYSGTTATFTPTSILSPGTA
ncbi:MAG TPA: Ig-like domain-containing protein, partial [Puia sp.]|nr:Ig-like domain-containing protein [Puia sp.]